jgi:hypothetical protein
MKYPSPATAVKSEVFTACQSVPPDTAAKDKVPDPFVFKNVSADPSAFGKVNPSRTMFPEPFGVIVMLPLAPSTIVITPEFVPLLVSNIKLCAPLDVIVASAAPVPTTTSPVPFGDTAKSILESPPKADNLGSLPVAEFVTFK